VNAARVAELFAELLDVDPGVVETRLAAEPPELAAEVRALLHHDAAADSFLEKPPLLAETPPLEIPATIGRFQVTRQLGRGGMGVVYAAHDPELDRNVAIKVLGGSLFDTSGKSRLLAEARTAAKLSHPHVVPIYEVGERDGDVFVVMELVEGSVLSQKLATVERWQDILILLLQAGDGLSAVHKAGLAHRDIKPDNVLVGLDGRARLADFGLATAETGKAASAGTPLYMAPEQWLGRGGDAKSDQFAFAVMVVEALTGKHPFYEATVPQIVERVRAGKLSIVSRPEIPAELFNALERSLSPDPEQRWGSVEILLEELRHVAGPGFDRDLRVGRRARILSSFIILAMPFVGYPFARMRLGDHASSRDLFLMALPMNAALFAALPFLWRIMKRNAVNRAAFRVLWMGPVVVISSRFVSMLGGLPANQVFAHDLLALAVVITSAAFNVHRAFAVAAAGCLLLSFLAALFPAWWLEAYALGIFLIGLSTVLIWAKVSRS
jgi:eukaryotic-like serine/threonine-protein kinase